MFFIIIMKKKHTRQPGSKSEVDKRKFNVEVISNPRN